MKSVILFLSLTTAVLAVSDTTAQTYVASTPAHLLVRKFLRIPLTDSIDFIRWDLELGQRTYTLKCRYGLAAPATPGFRNEPPVSVQGQLSRSGNRYELKHGTGVLSVLELNRNVLHILDDGGKMLPGNGGYSYALNTSKPVKTDTFNCNALTAGDVNPLVFEGRTPCQELSALLGLGKSEACNKMKWYVLFYTDPLTKKPSYFLKGGIGHKKETMDKGTWEIVNRPGGRVIYRMHFNQWSRPLDLVRGDDNILFFLDANDRLLVGNEDFSYTLNRRQDEYPRADAL